MMPIIQPLIDKKSIVKEEQEGMPIEIKQKIMLDAIEKMGNALKSI